MIIDSPIISGSSAASGSLNQFGNVTITGSLNVTGGITGSIIGSASYANNADTLDGIHLSILATTGSNTFSGTQTITGSILQSGSFTSTGTITAQTLVIQTITSSVDYVTGSTRFGSLSSNTHVFTGSVSISGSLNTNGPITGSSFTGSFTGSLLGTASRADNATSASYSNNSTSASYAANATTASYALVAAAGGFPYTGSAQITGSLGVTGSVNSTSFTGSLLGTASYANYSLTSSYSLAGSGFPFSGSAVITGSLLVTNLSSSGVSYLVADSTGFITAQTASAAIKSTQAVTSTAGQTSFTITNGYTTGLVDVYINGTKLSAAEFTDTSGTVITLATGSNNGDTVEFVKYFPASGVTNNALRQQTTFTASAGQTVFSASYTPGLLDIYYNGSRLSTSDYTANSGTYFTLATASAANDILDVLVYSYQVGAFSGIGGAGVANQISYFTSTNAVTSSTAVTISGTNAIVTGSLLGTASYANDAGTLDGLDSTVFTLTSSFNPFSASFNAFSASHNAFTASINTFTSSAVTRLGALEAATASLYTATSSFSGRVGALESYTASLNLKTASFATTGSNTFTGTQYVSNTNNAIGFSNTTSSIYTDGGLQVTKDAYISSSLYIKGNLTVYGTQSVSYITSSQLNISTNLITVNTATPSIRFGGLAVIDSGSASGLTGSLLWDSQNNTWIYSNPSGSGNYDSAMVMMGPQNSSGLGNEVGITTNALVKGAGSHHMTSSGIFEVSGSVGIGTSSPLFALDVKGSGSFTNTLLITGSGGTYLNIKNSVGSDSAVYMNDGTNTAYAGLNVGSSPNKYVIYYGGAVRVAIDTSGNVGIGVTPTRGVLDINGGRINLMGNASDGKAVITLGDATYPTALIQTPYTGGNLQLAGSGGNGIYISGSGNIGIGTTTPGYLLEVGTTGTTNSMKITVGSGNNLILSKPTGPSISFLKTNTTAQSWSVTTDPNFRIVDDTRSVDTLYIASGSGNVGVGTSSPAYKLHTEGAILANNAGTVGLYVVNTTVSAGNSSGTTAIYMGDNGSGVSMIQREKQTVNTTGLGLYFEYGYNVQRQAAMFTNGEVSFYIAGAKKLTLDSSGNLGVGTTTPCSKLDINGGSIRMGEYLNSASSLIGKQRAATGGFYSSVEFNSSSGEDQIIFNTHLSGVSAGERMRITGGGKVGIGVTSPDQALHVTDTASDTVMKLGGGGAARDTNFSMYSQSATNTVTAIHYNGTMAFYNSKFTITSGGNATLVGSLTQNTSDIRLKTNITTIENAIDKIKQLSGFTYNWNSLANELGGFNTTIKEVGVAAQSVKEVVPEAVFPAPFDNEFNPATQSHYSKSGENYLTVQYEKLVPLLIEGIKEQQCTINTLKTCLGIS